MTAIAYALVAMVGWAVGDVANAYAARDVGNRQAFFWWLVCAAAFSSLYIPFAGPIADTTMFAFAIILGFFASLGTFFYFRALEIGNIALVGAIGGSFPFITVLLSLVLYGETLSIFQFMGFALILFGLILASLNPAALQGKSLKHLTSDPGVIPALASFVLWGVYFAVLRTPIETIGWFWAGYPGYWFFLILLCNGMANRKTLKTVGKTKSMVFIAVGSALALLANFSYNLGLSTGDTSVVAPIAGSFPVLFVLLSRFAFHDRLSRTQAVGIVLSLVGIIFMSLVT